MQGKLHKRIGTRANVGIGDAKGIDICECQYRATGHFGAERFDWWRRWRRRRQSFAVDVSTARERLLASTLLVRSNCAGWTKLII
eukprot:6174895-Pleurochrysis_carterae.AAC.3